MQQCCKKYFLGAYDRHAHDCVNNTCAVKFYSIYLIYQNRNTMFISNDTKAFIGFKFEAKGTNYTKLVCAKSRYYDITVENDLFNIRAYTLRGVKELNVMECKGVFIDGLSDALLLMAIK